MGIFAKSTDPAAVVADLERRLELERQGAETAYEDASVAALEFECGDAKAAAKRDAAMAAHDKHVARQSELEAALRAARKDRDARAAEAAQKAQRLAQRRAREALKAHNEAASEVDKHLAAAGEALAKALALQTDILQDAPALADEIHGANLRFVACLSARFRAMPNVKGVMFWPKENVDWAPHCVQLDRVGGPE